MNKKTITNDFLNDGYFISKNTLTLNELNLVEDSFKNFKFDNKFVFDPFIKNPKMSNILFNNKLISDIESILGKNFIILPDTSLHLGRRNVNHTDYTSLLANDIRLFDYEDDFKMVTIGTYLQDSKGGNGLNVTPQSHLNPDFYLKYRRVQFYNKLLNLSRKLLPEVIYKYIHPHNFSGIDVDSRRGDSIIFDIKINHRSQYKKFPFDFFPDNKPRKAVFHRACSNHPEIACKYIEYLKCKNGYDYLSDLNRSIPPSIISQSQKYNVKIL